MTIILDYGPGLHRDVPPAIYHARHLGLVSKSALDLVHRSPLHYKTWVDGAKEAPSPALEFGALFHCALLEPDRFGAEYAVAPDFGDLRTKVAKEAREKWRAENEGKKALEADDDERVRGMCAAVRAHPLAGKMLREGVPELTVRWKDPETGLECKTRADYYVERLGMVVDVKSADDASFDAFRKSVANFRYHVQDALYRASFGAVGVPIAHFVYVVVEKRAPYAVATYTLDSDGIQRGYAHATRDMNILAERLREDEWPGYPLGIQALTVPPWAA